MSSSMVVSFARFIALHLATLCVKLAGSNSGASTDARTRPVAAANRRGNARAIASSLGREMINTGKRSEFTVRHASLWIRRIAS